MRNQWRRFALVLSFVLPLLVWTTGGTAQENGGGAGAEPGSLWLLNTYSSCGQRVSRHIG
jgi:hypothetical protein